MPMRPPKFPRSRNGTRSATMISVSAMIPPPPMPCTARGTEISGSENQGIQASHTSSANQHVHRLRGPSDRGASCEQHYGTQHNIPATKYICEATRSRHGCRRRYGIGTANPDEVGTTKIVDDSWQSRTDTRELKGAQKERNARAH
jgi:hypothetical protein